VSVCCFGVALLDDAFWLRKQWLIRPHVFASCLVLEIRLEVEMEI
jgi:hypothetical protein